MREQLFSFSFILLLLVSIVLYVTAPVPGGNTPTPLTNTSRGPEDIIDDQDASIQITNTWNNAPMPRVRGQRLLGRNVNKRQPRMTLLRHAMKSDDLRRGSNLCSVSIAEERQFLHDFREETHGEFTDIQIMRNTPKKESSGVMQTPRQHSCIRLRLKRDQNQSIQTLLSSGLVDGCSVFRVTDRDWWSVKDCCRLADICIYP